VSNFVIEPSPRPAVAVAGGGLFPVRRIFCVGRNYADHVKEMFGDPKTTPPVFFTKPADAVVASGATIPYPTITKDFHYEGELVVALKAGGSNISPHDTVEAMIFGYAAGCDLTRRDIQAASKKAGTPWDAAKGFDNSAAIGEITPATKGLLDGARLTLSVNGAKRQDEALASMIWSIPEIIATLSKEFELKAGDLIFTGTPAGVGPLKPGDEVEVRVGKLAPLMFSIGEPR
jgi:fumarylpyruvate hydrolase